MAQWRGLLGMPDYGECRVRAVPDRQMDAIHQFAMATSAADFTELMSNWARFVALLLAEVNASLMRARKLQEANREKWSMPSKRDDKNDDQEDKPDGEDIVSMMQTNKPVPVFTLLRRLRQSIELLPPRRRSTRTALLLQRLFSCGHYRHGMRVLEPYLRALAVEDVDVAWCEAVWDNILEALNAALLQEADKTRANGARKRKERAEDGAGSGQVVRMEVTNGTGTAVGACSIPVPDSTQPLSVHLQHMSAASSAMNQVSLQVLPSSADQMFQLWCAGILTDVAVCARLGLGTSGDFRDRLAALQRPDGVVHPEEGLESPHGSPVTDVAENAQLSIEDEHEE